MEALDSRHSIGLPSISNLDQVKREEMDYQRKHSASAAPMGSLHPLAHHGHQSSAASTLPGALGGLLSPPESRRTSGEDDAQRQPARHSLPSIQEALGGPEPPHAFPVSAPGPPPAPTSAPQSYFPPSTTSPTDQRTRAFSTDIHGNQGPSNPFAHTRSPFMGTSSTTGPPPPPPPAPLDSLPRPSFSEPRPSFSEPRPSYSAPQQNSKLPALHPIRTDRSPPPGPVRPSYSYNNYPPQSSATYEPAAPHSAGPMNPNYGYQQQYPSSYPLSAPAPGAPNAAYPPSATTYSAPPRPFAGQWDSRLEEKKLNPASLAPYGESVKRHLESFDLEASLNEMAEGAGRITDFSKIYRQRAHETQRIGMTPQSMPRLDEVDDMIKHSERVQISLQRMREVVFNHQASLVEPPQDPRYGRMNGYEHDAQSNYGDDLKGVGGFAGPDPKKRRGPTQRAAPPGRCHSCNRAETPEWRRGPDGARTLCNACGLHYAKLTRKMGGKQAMTSSNLRPKSLDQGSPTG
ncbi:GATA zinc finger domain-containing protein 10 [Paraphaeosphaeria sporulosa]